MSLFTRMCALIFIVLNSTSKFVLAKRDKRESVEMSVLSMTFTQISNLWPNSNIYRSE